jgi:hypothetical protein
MATVPLRRPREMGIGFMYDVLIRFQFDHFIKLLSSKSAQKFPQFCACKCVEKVLSRVCASERVMKCLKTPTALFIMKKPQ